MVSRPRARMSSIPPRVRTRATYHRRKPSTPCYKLWESPLPMPQTMQYYSILFDIKTGEDFVGMGDRCRRAE